MKRKSRSGTNVVRAALDIAIQSSLHQQAALDHGMKLWSDMLNFSPLVGYEGRTEVSSVIYKKCLPDEQAFLTHF